jgi:outer membrane protein assembly factor BamB
MIRLTRLLLLAVVLAAPSPQRAAAQQHFQLTADDHTEGLGFGHTVSLDGTRAVVGSPGSQGDAGGAVYIFDTRSGSQIAKLQPSDAVSGDLFGYAVSVKNGLAVIGAMRDDTTVSESGSAYVYDLNTQTQLLKLAPDSGSVRMSFGYSVATDGRYAVIGAPNDDFAHLDAGAAYVFDMTTGSLVHKLRSPTVDPLSYFGRSVAIDNGLILIGADSEDRQGFNSGAAHLFNLATGRHVRTLQPSDANTGAHFGQSVAMSGDIAIVGAPEVDGLFGAAYLFNVRTGEELAKLSSTVSVSMDAFGYSVAIEGNTAAVGARYRSASGGPSMGAAYAYDVETAGLLAQFTDLKPIGGGPTHAFVSVQDDLLLAGSPTAILNGRTSSGVAFLFRFPEPTALTLTAMLTGCALLHRRPNH